MPRADTKFPGFKSDGLKWYPDDMIIAPPTAGKYIFVDGNVGTSGSGTDWSDAFKTVEEGTDAGGTGDVVMVAPKATNGYYDENVRIGDGTAATEYQKQGLHLMGVTNNLKNVRIKAVASSAELHPYGSLSGVAMLGSALFVNCSGIEVSNLCFDAEGDYYSGVYWGDGYRPFAYTGQTDAQNGSIHDCTFKFGTTGLYYDGCSNDQHAYNNYFYKQTDEAIYIGPGGLQQSSRVHVYDNFFNGAQDYGVYIYGSANVKDHVIGPGNVFKDQLHGTTSMTHAVVSTSDTPTNAVIGNYLANNAFLDLGTNDISCGNYRGKDGATEEFVAED